MGLLNTPAFEDADDTTSAGAVFANAPQTDTAEQAAVIAAKADAIADGVIAAASQPATAATSTAMQVRKTNPNAVAIMPEAYALSEGMKHALVVDFNTFPQITATNGNFVERETKAILGDTIHFELESYQDSWVVDPGDDKAPKDLVRYSDDGAVCSDGTPVQEHIKFLKAGGYPLASLKQRSVVVGELLSSSKGKDKYVGDMIQFDLSPMSRVQWQRYLANSVNSLRKGRKTKEQLKMVTATAELATNGDNTYTKATFAVSTEAATA